MLPTEFTLDADVFDQANPITDGEIEYDPDDTVTFVNVRLTRSRRGSPATSILIPRLYAHSEGRGRYKPESDCENNTVYCGLWVLTIARTTILRVAACAQETPTLNAFAPQRTGADRLAGSSPGVLVA